MSPEIGTKIREGADDIKLNVPYMINDVEEVVTEKENYNGYRVELLDVKANLGSVMLWSRPVTSPRSKLGAFITLLGSNTDKWLHKWIIFRTWETNNRNVQFCEIPGEKVVKPKAAKPAKEVSKGA